MRSRTLVAFTLFFVGSCVVGLPHLVHAAPALPFFGHIIPDADATCPAGFGLLPIVINNIIRFALSMVIVFIAPLFIAYAGFLLVANQGNPGQLTKAREVLTNTVIGIVIALAAWLIVDALLVALTGTGHGVTNWTQLIEGTTADVCQPQAGSTSTPTQPSGVSTGVSPTSGGGTCAAPTVGPCTVAALTGTCFYNNAAAAAQVCSTESHGAANALSKGDVTADGKAYSVGLFQINITNSYSKVDGYSCGDAFTEPCQNSGGYNNVQTSGAHIGACSATVKSGMCGTVTCAQLYNDCLTSAQTAQYNIMQACQLSSNGTNWGRWLNTKNKCGL